MHAACRYVCTATASLTPPKDTTCADDFDCTSSKDCRGGQCCDDLTGFTEEQCVACDSKGKCRACKDEFYISGTSCVKQSKVGDKCSASTECLSQACFQDKCCEVDPQLGERARCTDCECSSCEDGYMKRGRSCVPRPLPGQLCSESGRFGP